MAKFRKAEQDLAKWAEESDRKPLIIRGARQVGKSTLVRSFGRRYDQYIELNLELEASWGELFERSSSVEEFIQRLGLRLGTTLLDRRTLIFIDEIQNSPQAIFLLRYFYETFPELHVIAAGSLLEFAMKDVKSFPVGRVQYYYLSPLDFEEFLVWQGKDLLLQLYRQTPLPAYATDDLFAAYNEYIVLGGMPAAVKTALEKEKGALPAVYNTIWQSYLDDVEKYADDRKERQLLRFLLERVPFEEGRITFRGFGGSNHPSRTVGQGLRTLEKTRILRLVYPTTSVELPLAPDYGKSPKLQLLDTGLLIHALGVQADLVGVKDLQRVFGGRLVEHHLLQEYSAQFRLVQYQPRFWVRQKAGSNAELDLVHQYRLMAIPVEIKAGPQGRLRSLHQFVERATHPYAVRFLRNEFAVERHRTPAGSPYYLMNLPYFLIGRLDHYLSHLLENYPADDLHH